VCHIWINGLGNFPEGFEHFFLIILGQIASQDISKLFIGRLLDSNINLAPLRIQKGANGLFESLDTWRVERESIRFKLSSFVFANKDSFLIEEKSSAA
jgi:hypothetical protein